MSETQTETDAEPDFSHIHAPWHLESSDGLDDVSEGYLAVVNENDGLVGYAWEDDAPIIAAAGTAAQEAKEMGYDPVAAVEALPELLEALEGMTSETKPLSRVAKSQQRTALMKAQNALASAEGSEE